MRLRRLPRLPQPIAVGSMDDIFATGAVLSLTGPHEPCPMCGCRFGGHVGVMSQDPKVLNAFGGAGGIECDTCDQGCGTLSMTEIPTPN